MEIHPDRLCVRLDWHGRVVDGPLRRRVKSRESVWCLSGLDDSGEFGILHIMMPKDTQHYWRSLFEGSEEKSHIEVGSVDGALRDGALRTSSLIQIGSLKSVIIMCRVSVHAHDLWL